MSKVQVNLYAALRRYIGGAPSVDVEVKPDCTVARLLDQLGVPADQTRIIFVDNRTAGPDHVLQDGQQIGIFPAIGGG